MPCRKVTAYLCPSCSSEYDSLEEAQLCAASHVKPLTRYECLICGEAALAPACCSVEKLTEQVALYKMSLTRSPDNLQLKTLLRKYKRFLAKAVALESAPHPEDALRFYRYDAQDGLS